MNNQQSPAGVIMTSASMVLIPREDPVGKLVFVVIVLALGVLFYVALTALLTVMMPVTAQRSRAVLTRAPWQAFFVGFLICAVLGGAAGWLFSGSYIRLLLRTEWVWSKLAGGIAIVGAIVIMASMGATGTVAFVGDRLAALSGREISSMKKLIRGALFVVLGGFFPFTGWFVVMPIVLSSSVGAAILGWLTAYGDPASEKRASTP